MIILILPLLVLTLSDYALGISQSEKRPMKGINGNRLSVSFLPNQSRDCLILAGRYNADRSRYKSIAREFLQQGFSVFLFDFSGHGRSWGKTLTKEKAILPQAGELALIEKQILETGLFTKENLYYLGDESGATALVEAASREWIHPKALILFDLYKIPQEHRKEENLQALSWFEKIKTNPPYPIHELASSAIFFRSYDLLKRKNIEALLNETEAVRRSLHTPTLSFYPTLRIVALFCFFIALLITPFLYLLVHLILTEKKKRKSVASNIEIFTKKDFLKTTALLLFWIPTFLFTFGLIFFLKKSSLPLPLASLQPVLFIGFLGILKISFFTLSPEKWGFKQILSIQKNFKIALSNKERELEAFRSGIIYAFSFLILYLLIARLALFYVVPRNTKQIWLPFLTMFVFPGFFIAALENYDASKSMGKIISRTIVHWLPLYLLPLLGFPFDEYLFYLPLLTSLILMGQLMIQKEVKPLQIAFFQSLIFVIVTLSQGALISFSPTLLEFNPALF